VPSHLLPFSCAHCDSCPHFFFWFTFVQKCSERLKGRVKPLVKAHVRVFETLEYFPNFYFNCVMKRSGLVDALISVSQPRALEVLPLGPNHAWISASGRPTPNGSPSGPCAHPNNLPEFFSTLERDPSESSKKFFTLPARAGSFA